ncbi:glycine/sarcosine/betaine reductase component B subunit [Acetomicrobium mobile]|uniref:glycine/sarcosine/betaine reductase component B subunit n=1 Tax=Acetomicrobium mobile TaxID=97477 RepID=UPI0026EA1BCA|nr:glycine/sarcosine/betaine reductase component B subunit [Acetomicrobium mobile]
MRLELHKVKVRDVRWGDATKVEGGVLYVDKTSALEEVKDDAFAKVDLELARPGESTRIIPVKDCIEPRVKLSGGNGKEYFPGFCSPMQRAGSGATLVLDGAAVVTCGSIVAFQEGFIDMSGEGARYTHFSKTNNVVLVVEPVEGLDKHKYEAALRIAGLKLATYLARACKDSKADEVATFEKGSTAEESAKYPDLPKILYVCMSIAQGLLHDTYVYGEDIKLSFPFLLHPNEVLDGAVVSGNCVSACDKNTTYHHVNNPVVCDLYERHGKDLNFLGVAISPESTVLAGKVRNALMSAAIGVELGADGVVITEEGYGNPDTDLCLTAKYFEEADIKTVVISDEAAGTDGKSQSLADATPEMNAFVSTGNVNEMIVVPPMEKIIGEAEAIALLSGGSAESLREDGSMYVELQSVIGSTVEIGYGNVGCEWV